ncbi:MAG TPA: MFS transporter [Candidatus Limnocylindrales bacterium]|nr:MFS transporter [Candidatus Limnocylindrales bacterium]
MGPAEPVAAAAAGSTVPPPPVDRSLISRTFASFHHRDFRLFYAGQLISVTGTWMQTVAAGWLVLTLTGSPLALGLVAVARALPVLLLSFVGGTLADRVDRRRLLLIANGAAAIVSTVLAFLTATERIDVAGVLLLSALLGVTFAFEMPARQSWIVELTGPRHLANAIALNSLLFNSARIIGPALAGLIVAAFGPATAFAINALSFIPVIGVLLLIRPTPIVRPRLAGRRALGDVVTYLRAETPVALMLALLAANTTFASGYIVLAPALARDLGQGAAGLGFLMAAAGLGAVAAGLILAASGPRMASGRTLVVSGLLLAAFVAGIGMAGSFAMALLLLVGLGFAMISYTATSNTLIQTVVPEALRGRVMSLYVAVMVGMMPANGLFAGVVAERFGVSAAFVAGAVIWAACVVVAFAASARLRRLRP